MWKQKRLPIILLLIAAGVAGCYLELWGYLIPKITYPPLGPITRIEIKAGASDGQVQVIDEPSKVRRIVEFVDGHLGGWGGASDWAGVPVPQVTVSLYEGAEFKGHFGVGPGFFECQRNGQFASKHCSAREERQFLELVGLLDYPFTH